MDAQDEGDQRVESGEARVGCAQDFGPWNQITAPPRPPPQPDQKRHRQRDSHSEDPREPDDGSPIRRV